MAKPTSPTMALRSPPAIRRTMRSGQPRKTSAVIMTNAPSTKRVIGEEPPRGRNSFFTAETMSAPSTRPMISGRMYWTTAAWCIPTAPAVSRMKQAMQKPMFLGFPNQTSAGGDDADDHAGEDDFTFFLQCQHLKADLIRMRFLCYYSTNIWHMEIAILNKPTVFIDIIYIYGAGGKSGVQ